MLSWATYPALDPTRPAGLSRVVVANELRGRLGFRGVTITDSIGAGALDPYGSYANRGALAAQAGDDLMLCAVTDPAHNNVDVGVHVLSGIVSALANRGVSLASARQAAIKIIDLRSQP
jgi:beta-N-acetylhexosaminidase